MSKITITFEDKFPHTIVMTIKSQDTELSEKEFQDFVKNEWPDMVRFYLSALWPFKERQLNIQSKIKGNTVTNKFSCQFPPQITTELPKAL